MTLRLGYLTGEYPRATDTFIQREVAALRDLGHVVRTFSVRRPDAREIVDTGTVKEREGTFYLLDGGIWRMLWAQAVLKIGSPMRMLRAFAVWLKICPRNPVGFFKHIAYFMEACLLARQMQRRGLAHLHNHFSDSSCTVAMLASILGGFTFSFTLHGPADFVCPGYWRVNEKIRRATTVICISQYAKKQAMRFAAEDCRGKMRVVHCGVEVEKYEGRTPTLALPRRTEGGKRDGGRLLFVGRLAAVKGLGILLEALAIVRRTRAEVSLTIAGDGPHRGELEALAKELGIGDGVTFVGYQSQEQVRGLLAETDLFVMTSLAEGLPVVLMEAMAAGVAVVAPRIAGIPELVEDGVSGLLTRPADAAATAAAILKLVSDGELRARLGEAGWEKVRREFDIHQGAQRMAEIFAGKAGGREEGDGGRVRPPYVGDYVVISPCRNEAGYLRRSIESVLRQTVRPGLWIIVDDGSTDATPAILAEYAATYPFIRIVTRADRGYRKLGGGVIDAFYDGYNTIDPGQFDYIAKLDLDVELPAAYFATLMERMESEPRIGTCSGKPHYLAAGRIVKERCGDEQSVGMAKFYRMRCFQEIGGFVHELMWDGIDGHRCRMLGWMAVSWDEPEINFEHLRPMGSSDKGWWTGRKRHGEGQYFMGTGMVYLLASCVYRLGEPPVVVGSVAMLWGYLVAMCRRRARYGDEEFGRYLRRYQWECFVRGKAMATARCGESGGGNSGERPTDCYPSAS